MLPIHIILVATGVLVGKLHYTKRQKTTSLIRSKKKNHTLPMTENTVEQSTIDLPLEVSRSKNIASYSLALTAPISLFFPVLTPVSSLISGYNTYNLYHLTFNKVSNHKLKPIDLFEIMSSVFCVLTQRNSTNIFILLIAFIRRKFQLDLNNILTKKDHYKNTLWILQNGAEIEISAQALKKGDIVVFSSGDLVSIQGEVIEGNATLSYIDNNHHKQYLEKTIGDEVGNYTFVEQGKIVIRPNAILF